MLGVRSEAVDLGVPGIAVRVERAVARVAEAEIRCALEDRGLAQFRVVSVGVGRAALHPYRLAKQVDWVRVVVCA